MDKDNRICITGAGGFIGNHLVSYLKRKGYWVRGVDIKYPEFSPSEADEFELLDLRRWANCLQATRDVNAVYALAADMGGMGYISNNHSQIMHNNILINTHTLEASRINGVRNYLFSSSACVYPTHRQSEADLDPLKEDEALPAQPQDAYGWEKLITEQLCKYYCLDHEMEMHIVRFHNIFGEMGTWEGGREKAPAAICRKVAIAKFSGIPEVEIWGDGNQTRSFCYITDCLKGIYKLMQTNFHQPLNLGQDRMVTINQLVDIVAEIAGIKIVKKHIEGPLGVRGRNSDNTRIKEVLAWAPEISLEAGLAKTYHWIEEQVSEKMQVETKLAGKNETEN